MKYSQNSSIGEVRVREKIPFLRHVQLRLSGDDFEETFTQKGLSINPVSVTIQVGMSDSLFDYLEACFRGDLTVTISYEDLLDKKRIFLRHTRRYRTVLTKWIFSFTGTIGSRRLRALSTE